MRFVTGLGETRSHLTLPGYISFSVGGENHNEGKKVQVEREPHPDGPPAIVIEREPAQDKT